VLDLVAPVPEVQQLADACKHLDVGRGVATMGTTGRRRDLRRGLR
jgi:hypothetical protein